MKDLDNLELESKKMLDQLDSLELKTMELLEQTLELMEQALNGLNKEKENRK